MSMTIWEFDELCLERARDLYVGWGKTSPQQKAANATNIAKGNFGLGTAQQLSSTAQGIQGSLLPAYQTMLKGPSAAETLSTVGGLGATEGAQRDALSRRAASTHNPAAYTAGLDKLAQTQDQQTADAMAKLTTADRDRALAGLSNLYGVDTATMERLLQPGAIQGTAGIGSLKFGIPGVAEAGVTV